MLKITFKLAKNSAISLYLVAIASGFLVGLLTQHLIICERAYLLVDYNNSFGNNSTLYCAQTLKLEERFVSFTTHCTNISDDLFCTCKENFFGKTCELHSFCLSEPCKYQGQCLVKLEEIQKPFCKCVAGIVGRFCSINIDDCANVVCHNGGKCVDLINRYECNCSAGYTTQHCQEEIDECSSNPCQHGGTCFDKLDRYKCRCLEDYVGNNCEHNRKCYYDIYNITRYKMRNVDNRHIKHYHAMCVSHGSIIIVLENFVKQNYLYTIFANESHDSNLLPSGVVPQFKLHFSQFFNLLFLLTKYQIFECNPVTKKVSRIDNVIIQNINGSFFNKGVSFVAMATQGKTFLILAKRSTLYTELLAHYNGKTHLRRLKYDADHVVACSKHHSIFVRIKRTKTWPAFNGQYAKQPYTPLGKIATSGLSKKEVNV